MHGGARATPRRGSSEFFAATPVPLLASWRPGLTVYGQYLWLDACGSQGFSASNALSITLQ